MWSAPRPSSRNSNTGQANRQPDLSDCFEAFAQKDLHENRCDDWLHVRDDSCESQRNELDRVEHTEETHTGRPEPDHNDQDPGAAADRYRMTKEISEGDQADPGERGPQRHEGKMRREIQDNGDKRKAGSPKQHDSQEAQGGTDGHCSSAKHRPVSVLRVSPQTSGPRVFTSVISPAIDIVSACHGYAHPYQPRAS